MSVLGQEGGGYIVNVAAILDYLYPGIVIAPDDSGECSIEMADGKVAIRNWMRAEKQPTDAELKAAEAAALAAIADKKAQAEATELDRDNLRKAFQAAADRLNQIATVAPANNAQVIAAVQDIARYQLHILKALRGIV